MDSFTTQNAIITTLSKSISTGNIMIDIVFSFLVSSLIAFFFSTIKYENFCVGWRWTKSWFKKKVYTTEIKCEYRCGENGKMVKSQFSQNQDTLINSIEYYLASLEPNPEHTDYTVKISEPDEHIPNIHSRMMQVRNELIPAEVIVLKSHNVEVSVTINENEKTVNKEVVITSNNLNSISTFIKTCHEYYVDRKYIKKLSYYFPSYHQNWSGTTISFHCLEYAPNKTFNDIWFEQKPQLIKSIDKFVTNNTGKFTLLLYGPPGTGKTSVIKALANYTQRNIFHVNLSQIKSYEDAFSVMFNTQVNIYDKPNSSTPLTHYINMNERIVVFEDIDVECTGVHNRDEQEKTENKEGEYFKEKKLNLSSILQLFDGVYEPNGLIMVVTTNRVEKLDSAFVRPGRMTMSIHMKELDSKLMFEMIKHSYPEEDMERLRIANLKLTASQLEQFINQASDYDEFVDVMNSL